MYYNDSDQARESGLRRAFVESMQELMKCVNTLAAGAAKKAYCYLNICGMDVFTGCFFVDGDGRATLASALLGGKQGIFEAVMTAQARKLRGAYIEYADDIPGEFFLDFDIGAKKPHCLTGKEKYPKHDEALLHFYSWAREYGADTPTIPLTDLTMRDRIRIRRGKMLPYVEFVHPTEKAEEMNLKWYSSTAKRIAEAKEKYDGSEPSDAVYGDGWLAIEKEFERIYPGQTEPKHYAPLIKFEFGGRDPLDGISVYDGGDCWHFVSFGLSALAEPDIESDEGVSGYGMEFTLRLKKQDFADEELELENICGIFQQIAAVTFETNELFLPYEYLSSGQTAGVDAEHKSGITGFITVPDVKAQPITTPFGALEFVEFVGVTKAELDAVQNKCLTVEELYGKLGSDLTDYRRESVI